MLTTEHNAMLTALLSAGTRPVPVTPTTPDGRSRWHSAQRLQGWGLVEPDVTETDVNRVGAALQRRGLAAHKTLYGTTRWTLTEAGAAEARRLARSVTA